MTLYSWPQNMDQQPDPAPPTMWGHSGEEFTWHEETGTYSWPSGPGSSPLTDDITWLQWNGVLSAHGPASDLSAEEAESAVVLHGGFRKPE